MGQQQLLLIVLGALVVGIAVYGGLRVMDGFNQDNDRDLLMNQMQSIVAEARTYAAKPSYLGGGEGTLTNFSPPQSMTTTDRYRIYAGTAASSLTLTGFGSVAGHDGQNPVNVVLSFTLGDNAMVSEVIN
jgi:hypothetical protein